LAIGTTVCSIVVFTAQPASALQPAGLESTPALIIPIADPENEAAEGGMAPSAEEQPAAEGEAKPEGAEEKPKGSEDMEDKAMQEEGMEGQNQ
jgi:hypothetical protein